jgi:DNA-binding SARP family transcriptional activator/tetratricopeptide (TPR) repeat protein
VTAKAEFGLLGPLMVRCGGAMVPFPAGKQRAVLAALLLNANQVVTLDELAEILWGSRPPASARVTIQNYAMRLRHALSGTGHSRIVTQLRGYQIRLAEDELDISRFEALLAAAVKAAGDGSWDRAADRAGAALALWRGAPLEDVPSELLTLREVPRLEEMRLQALEARIDADLQLGRQASVIGELRQLVAAHPLRERLHAQLMLALYRDSRQGEALAAFQAARGLLIEELGAEPGPGLRGLHQRILGADPALAVAAPGPPAGARAGSPVPRLLPASVRNFAGRAAELRMLNAMLDEATAGNGAVVISAIGGTAGVGKTALAVHWAHQVAGRFPDGQLYANLHGYDAAAPVPACDVLAGFLRELGVAGQDIPVETDERAARYRSLLAGKRTLVVLDNAHEAEQVRPLLPGTSASLAVVTSRDSLAGLVARHGALRLELDLLPLADAVGLLRALVGGRVDAEPRAAEVLATQCARLPLALRVAAEFAVTRPASSLAELTGELADRQRRLDQLDAGGDPGTEVRAVFSWSYRHLDAGSARAFRLLGLPPEADLDSFAVAALTGTTLARGRQVLGQLTRAHLIQATGQDRFSMHDLLRAYARGLAAADGEREQRAALTRLFDHYLHTAATAMDTLAPAERHRRPRIPPPGSPVPDVASEPAARAWLDSQRACLVAAAAYTASQGWPGHATRLAAILISYLDAGGYYPEAITIHMCARRAAAATGDRAAEATALTSLGFVHLRQGRYQQASDHLRQALVLFRETGDQSGQARALGNLGSIDHQYGRYQQASDHLRQALVLFRETGDQSGQARALANLGLVNLRRGRYREAADDLGQALTLSRGTGDQSCQARALTNSGIVAIQQRRYRQAAGQLQQALALFRGIGDPSGEAYALANLGEVDLRQDRCQQAAGRFQQALALFRETGNRSGEVTALNGLGGALLAAGRPGEARAQHSAALELSSRIGARYEEACSHDGLARTHHATGDTGLACAHWQQALAIYADLGAPEAGEIRSQLAAGPRRARPGPGRARPAPGNARQQ